MAEERTTSPDTVLDIKPELIAEEKQPSSLPDHSDENEATKIIVLQLSFSSTEETVHEYFSKYGAIEKLDLKRYPDGNSRGFAFIIFQSEDALVQVLSIHDHTIDNRKVTVEKARTRSEKMQTNKIFIGKLPGGLTEDQMRCYFSTFGEIEKIEFVFHKQTNERKSFCFIEFKSQEAVEKITESKVPPESTRHTIESFEIECKKKFDDNHPIQRKIKAIERQKRGGDYYGGFGNYSHGNFGKYNYGPQYGYGNYGGFYSPNYPASRDMSYGPYNGSHGYGHEEYNIAYNGYYNGSLEKQSNGAACGIKNNGNNYN